eukprot:10726493-Lingulodinium_polyedra.AAC.1
MAAASIAPKSKTTPNVGKEGAGTMPSGLLAAHPRDPHDGQERPDAPSAVAAGSTIGKSST